MDINGSAQQDPIEAMHQEEAERRRLKGAVERAYAAARSDLVEKLSHAEAVANMRTSNLMSALRAAGLAPPEVNQAELELAIKRFKAIDELRRNSVERMYLWAAGPVLAGLTALALLVALFK